MSLISEVKHNYVNNIAYYKFSPSFLGIQHVRVNKNTNIASVNQFNVCLKMIHLPTMWKWTNCLFSFSDPSYVHYSSGHNEKTSSTTFISFLVFHYYCSTNAYCLVIIKNSFYIFFFYNDSSYSDCAILTAVIENSRSLNCLTYLHQHALISVVSLKPIGKNFILVYY